MEVIQGAGTSLLEILARDAVSGHEVRRMLAFAVLEEIVLMDRKCFCTRHGLFRYGTQNITSLEVK